MKKILKIWIVIIGAGGLGLAIAMKANFADIAGFAGLVIAALLVVYTAAALINWIIQNIIDRHRYDISEPDKDGGCYRVDRKSGSVEYILPKTGCLSPKGQGEIAEDEERMYRENS